MPLWGWQSEALSLHYWINEIFGFMCANYAKLLWIWNWFESEAFATATSVLWRLNYGPNAASQLAKTFVGPTLSSANNKMWLINKPEESTGSRGSRGSRVQVLNERLWKKPQKNETNLPKFSAIEKFPMEIGPSLGLSTAGPQLRSPNGYLLAYSSPFPSQLTQKPIPEITHTPCGQGFRMKLTHVT